MRFGDFRQQKPLWILHCGDPSQAGVTDTCEARFPPVFAGLRQGGETGVFTDKCSGFRQSRLTVAMHPKTDALSD
jgi:hypothetical protein